MSPYMWIVNGPRSIVPLDGEGMVARKRHRAGNSALSALEPAC